MDTRWHHMVRPADQYLADGQDMWDISLEEKLSGEGWCESM